MKQRLTRKLAFAAFLLLAGVQWAVAQTQVSGTVLFASDGEPVMGASVRVPGTTTGAATDINGKFSFTIPEGTSTTIEVTYLGTQTVRVTGRQGMTIRLKDNVEEVEEVVVTGMQRMDKRLFTGAAVKVSAEDAKLDGVPDISRSLEGRAAGVSVQNVSGTFGSAPKIRVRGATSIYGSSKPLWVVDGVIMEDVVDVSADDLSSGDANTLISSAIAGLNSDDIESFQILKDGSATCAQRLRPALLHARRTSHGTPPARHLHRAPGRWECQESFQIGFTNSRTLHRKPHRQHLHSS